MRLQASSIRGEELKILLLKYCLTGAKKLIIVCGS